MQRPRRGRWTDWSDLRVRTRGEAGGASRIALGRLRLSGRYRLEVSAKDDAGNDSARRVVRFRIRG